MVRKENVMTFELDDKTKKQKNVYSFEKTQDEKSDNKETPQDVKEKVKDSVVLKSNPFMFKADKKDEFGIESIEDFSVKVKRKVEMSLGELLRGNEYKKSKKSKVIIKSIKGWIKDFDTNNKSITSKANDTRLLVESVSVERIALGSRIILPIVLFLLLFITFKMGSIWSIDNGFMNTISAALDSSFKVGVVIAIDYIGIYLAFCSLMFIGIYDSICSDFVHLKEQHARINKNLQKKIMSDFSIKSKKTLRYYKKALRSNPCKLKPLPIEETGITKVDFNNVERITDAYIHKNVAIKKKQKMLKFFKFVFFKATYLVTGFVYGYILLYELLYKLLISEWIPGLQSMIQNLFNK